MIQRIQTIFLVLCAGAFGALIAWPFATSAPVAQDTSHIFADGSYSILDHLILEILTIAGILLALINIFLFRKRKTQMKLGYFLIVIGILIPVVAYLYFTNQAPTMSDSAVEDGPGIFLPIVAILCAVLANYFIRKDENKVRSMDRLR